MKKIGILFVIKAVFVLSCSACDTSCDIITVPNNVGILSFVGEKLGSSDHFWIKFEDSFDKIQIQLKIDAQFDFLGDKIYHQRLNLTKEQLKEVIPEEKWNDWHMVAIKVWKKEISLYPDPYIIEASIENEQFSIMTSLWWRLNTIKSFQILVEGGAEVSLGCHPCKEEESIMNGSDREESLAIESSEGEEDFEIDPYFNKTEVFPSQPIIEQIKDNNPMLLVIVGVNSLLILILFVVMVTCLIRRRSRKREEESFLGRPYLEGTFVREENIYDELKEPRKPRHSIGKDGDFATLASKFTTLDSPRALQSPPFNERNEASDSCDDFPSLDSSSSSSTASPGSDLNSNRKYLEQGDCSSPAQTLPCAKRPPAAKCQNAFENPTYKVGTTEDVVRPSPRSGSGSAGELSFRLNQHDVTNSPSANENTSFA